MKATALKLGLVGCVLFATALGAALSKGARVIVHNGVRADSLSAAELKNIYNGRTTYWSDGQPVVIVVLPSLTDAALKEVSGMDASQFKIFWQRMVFSGRGQQPKQVADAAELVAFVAATEGAIALVPENLPAKGVKALEVK